MESLWLMCACAVFGGRSKSCSENHAELSVFFIFPFHPFLAGNGFDFKYIGVFNGIRFKCDAASFTAAGLHV